MEQWVAALKSGNYPHGTGRLRSTYGYCCLGVMCDVLRSDVWTPIKQTDVFRFAHDSIGYPQASYTEQFGLSYHTGQLRGRNGVPIQFRVPKPTFSPTVLTSSLAEVNDSQTDFGAVIAILECYLENQMVNVITLTKEGDTYVAVGV